MAISKKQTQRKERLYATFFFLTLFLLIAFLFIPTLNIPLTSDDYIWVAESAAFNNFSDFVRDQYALKAVDFRYRPLMPTTVWLCYQVTGPEPFCFHWVGFILHFFNILLVGQLAYLVCRNKLSAWASMLFFAVYFAHVETVVWTSDLGNLLATFFMLITVRCFLAFGFYYNIYLWVLSLLTFGLAMISKESALALGPILGAWAIILAWQQRQSGPSRAVTVAAGFSYLLVEVLYVFLINRTGLNFAFSGTGNYAFHFNLISLRNMVNYPLNFIRPFDPARLEFFYQRVYDTIQLYPSFSSEQLRAILVIPDFTWIVGGTVLLWGLALWLLWRRQADYTFALSWLVLGILPVIFIGGFGERHLYIASVGLSLLIGFLCFGGSNTTNKGIKVKHVVPTLIFVSVLAFNIYWAKTRVKNWQVAGNTTKKIISSIVTHYPSFPDDAKIWVINLPDNYQGAYIFRLGLAAALQLETDSLDSPLTAINIPHIDHLPKPLTATQYAFSYEEGQLIDLTPVYRAN
ncbi:MAG: hypothetical protein KDJ65_19390 [Anaerolineae bacterium]|nr:hypothetical protein [Anaerolineae bacterium]